VSAEEALARLEVALGQLQAEEVQPALALLAASGLDLHESELLGARRRAVLLLAAGGDPRRGLALDGRAVRALAGDLETPDRAQALAAGLAELHALALAHARVRECLEALLRSPTLAWSALAAALLAEELEE